MMEDKLFAVFSFTDATEVDVFPRKIKYNLTVQLNNALEPSDSPLACSLMSTYPDFLRAGKPLNLFCGACKPSNSSSGLKCVVRQTNWSGMTSRSNHGQVQVALLGGRTLTELQMHCHQKLVKTENIKD
jgi:hypothetical protein